MQSSPKGSRGPTNGPLTEDCRPTRLARNSSHLDPNGIHNLHEAGMIDFGRPIKTLSAYGGENQTWRGCDKRSSRRVDKIKLVSDDAFERLSVKQREAFDACHGIFFEINYGETPSA